MGEDHNANYSSSFVCVAQNILTRLKVVPRNLAEFKRNIAAIPLLNGL